MDKDNSNPWLDAWFDPLSMLKTTTHCVRLGADLSADGDNKLIVCDQSKKLKVYRGTALTMETDLLDFPVAQCITYTELASPRIPSVAVAAGSHVFVYRQLRPYRKWSCPPVEISTAETEVWSDLKVELVDIPTAMQRLASARDSGVRLSSRSVDLLAMESEDFVNERLEYVNVMKAAPFVQQTLITCMDVIKKDSEDADAITLLVVGTESGMVYILPQDPSNSTFLCKVELPSGSIPVLLCVSGMFDVDWRIMVATRDGKMHVIKCGDVRGTAVLTGNVIDAGCAIVAMTRQDKFTWVATMDKLLSCYSAKGKRTRTIVVNEDISDLACVSVKRAKTNFLLLVALATGEIRLYKESKIFHSFTVEKPIMAMRFGAYGREANSLVIVHGKGALTFKFLKRMADLDGGTVSSTPAEQDIPLAIPKKTKLYVEQTHRERELGGEIHRAFQKDLCRLRLETARAYVKTLTDGRMLGSSSLNSSNVRIQVEVQGLGPKFLLSVTLQATGSSPLLQSKLIFSYNSEYYVMGHTSNSKHCINVPVLLPGPKHKFETEILNTDPQGRAGQVIVMLTHGLLSNVGEDVMSIPLGQSKVPPSSFVPILFANVKMPVSELLDV